MVIEEGMVEGEEGGGEEEVEEGGRLDITGNRLMTGPKKTPTVTQQLVSSVAMFSFCFPCILKLVLPRKTLEYIVRGHLTMVSAWSTKPTVLLYFMCFFSRGSAGKYYQ